ncbi:putative acyl-CoA dehydrogenase FadE17 [Actinomadura sp. NBRC 104412]|uniref:acyl-CoA dehydrogenase family protein n=1 Tax=Actinomadura sp. NBRC 104412 TaxID=3032203 RepID=UPI0024A138BD|nr:acyl-CoA dehydrogenase family protein [Actinomadura sp. NBRC 104412]GLZ09220.1 putative acyl-CoA dehydrogenase FadE17 [Actinomadura sp. NBRC 104412]
MTTPRTVYRPPQVTATAVDPGPEAEEFRREFRAWLSENAPPELRGVGWPAPPGSPHAKALKKWGDVLCEAGYMCVAWPREYGGRGLGPVEVAIMNEEFDRAGVPRVTRGRAETTVGPAIIAHGTEEQKAYFLPRIISGEHVYCQGFSEPGAGSDLASLRTAGVVDGDELVITGQKVWTSGYYEATMMFCLVRTDPDAPRHAGISYVLVPVAENGPGTGIEFRPIRQLTGRSGFAETFLDGARVPLFNVIGGLDQGWRVTVTTLGHERGNRATVAHVGYARDFWALVEEVRARGLADDPSVRERLAWAWTRIETMRFSGLQLLAALAAGQDPTGRAENGSVTKIRWSEYAREFGELALDLLGPDALTAGGSGDDGLGHWQEEFLSSRSGTIWGGTAEVQRNIIAERVLGLPKESRGTGR